MILLMVYSFAIFSRRVSIELLSGDVTLILDGDLDRLTATHGARLPKPIGVESQAGDLRITGFFDA
jgi:hypothetical protein